MLAAGPVRRNLRPLVVAIEDLISAGVGFVSLGESIDTGSPTGRLLLGVLGAFAEFERERIRERIHAGLERAKRQGQRLGRRRQRRAIDQWIVPTLGPIRLEQLKPATVQKWINQATADGGRPRTLLAHCVLRSALAWAMTQRVLTYNAAALCKVPRPTPKTVTPLTAEQGRQLLDAAAGQRLGAMVIVSLTMGLRIGEASGLSWGAVDLNARAARRAAATGSWEGPRFNAGATEDAE